MNRFEMVVLIVAIVMFAGVIRARYSHRHRLESDGETDGEKQRLRDEIARLKERLAVIERITIEKESSLEREIEQLRDR